MRRVWTAWPGDVNYNYACANCGWSGERFVPLADRDSLKCEVCDSILSRKFSRFRGRIGSDMRARAAGIKEQGLIEIGTEDWERESNRMKRDSDAAKEAVIEKSVDDTLSELGDSMYSRHPADLREAKREERRDRDLEAINGYGGEEEPEP